MPESTRKIAEKSIEEIVGEDQTPEEVAHMIAKAFYDRYPVLSLNARNNLANEVVSALRNERERCAKIAETHSATGCDGPDCGVVIAAAIRRSGSAGGCKEDGSK
jgi:hypothetical protein